jgi:hypothetical protein
VRQDFVNFGDSGPNEGDPEDEQRDDEDEDRRLVGAPIETPFRQRGTHIGLVTSPLTR